MTAVQPAAFFVLRTPLLPLDTLTALASTLNFDADLEASRARLREVARKPEVRDALFVASPEFDAAVERWLADPPRDDLKLEAALARYLARMTGRATPFGLFAGWSTGAVGARTHLTIGPGERHRPHSRLDMDYVAAVVEALTRDPEVRAELRYRRNPWTYELGGRLRYVEARVEGSRRRHRLVAVDPDDALAATLRAAGADGATRGELADALVDDDIDHGEALTYVDELIEAQLLVPDIAPAVAGPEPTRALATRLRPLSASSPVSDALDGAAGALAAADAAPAGERAARSRAVAGLLGELRAAAEPRTLIQVDLRKDAPGASLPAAVIDALMRGTEILHRLARCPEPDELRRFRERFAKRYEERAVGLVEALDPDSGIGFGAEQTPPEATETVRWGPPERLLVRLATQAAARGVSEVDLAPHEDVLLDLSPPAPLPDAFAVMAALAADSEAAVDSGDFEVRLIGLFGPSGANLLGRFCHADPVLREHVKAHLRAEEALDPDAVFAEVVHLPEGRLGNVLARPRLREYEIVLVAGSTAPAGRRLALDDLLLAHEDGRLVLRSQRLGRRVVPRLTSAHSFAGPGLGLYRFLGMLQRQATVSGLTWDWGPLATAPHLPRVRVGPTVLALERWRISPGELRDLARGTLRERFAAVQAWRQANAVTRLVGLERDESSLPVDLDDVLSVETLLRAAGRGAGAVLSEWWPPPERSAVTGPGGRYAHELIVPLIRDREPTAPSPARAAPAPVRRTFGPGSEWTYLKLYTGPAMADRILLEDVAPLVSELGDWHFLRYADPDAHLRLRARGGAARSRMLDLADRLVAAGRVWRATLDTYEREVERYGGARGIELAEAAFHADSEAVLALLAALPAGEEAAGNRWRTALVGAALLLRDLGLADPAAARVVRDLCRAYRAELGVDRHLVRELGIRFRRERPGLEASLELALARGDSPELAPLAGRAERLGPVAAELVAGERAGRLSVTMDAVAASLVHLHVVRLLRSSPRAQELLIYDALDRLYSARAGRARAGVRVR